ncbi:MAG: SAM-dependent methyltransferase [Bacilli bacterium]|nr:SAM-dependent methyltransferase [Bacilli bacterium]
MISKLFNYFDDENFIEAIISDKEKLNKTDINKIVIKRVILNSSFCGYQAAEYTKTQVKHINIENNKLHDYLLSKQALYRQYLLKTKSIIVHGIKNGNKLKISIENNNGSCKVDNQNNRQKNYILNDGDHLDFLVEQGVMSSNYRVKADMQHKFRQINRFLEFIKDIESYLPNDRPIHIIYFGCGKSYLTFAVYHYLHNILKKDIYIHGLDLKEQVIIDCNSLAKKLNYDNLFFEIGDISTYNCPYDVDMVMTLHACDTATDYALYNAIKWNAKVILSVPCYQHELNKQIKNDDFSSIFKYGIIQERTSSLFTDALRANILELQGYRTQILEFIDIEHTPKNLLIRAIKTGSPKKDWTKVDNFVEKFSIDPTLYRLLRGNKDEK